MTSKEDRDMEVGILKITNYTWRCHHCDCEINDPSLDHLAELSNEHLKIHVDLSPNASSAPAKKED